LCAETNFPEESRDGPAAIYATVQAEAADLKCSAAAVRAAPHFVEGTPRQKSTKRTPAVVDGRTQAQLRYPRTFGTPNCSLFELTHVVGEHLENNAFDRAKTVFIFLERRLWWSSQRRRAPKVDQWLRVRVGQLGQQKKRKLLLSFPPFPSIYYF
jgi:hypothetical protein